MNLDSSIGIIGGADGPTAIFVTGSLPGLLLPVIIVLLTLAAPLLWVRLRKKRRG